MQSNPIISRTLALVSLLILGLAACGDGPLGPAENSSIGQSVLTGTCPSSVGLRIQSRDGSVVTAAAGLEECEEVVPEDDPTIH